MTKYTIYVLIVAILALFWGLFWTPKQRLSLMNAEHITLKTIDNVNIVGAYYKSPGNKGVLLLHMMPATKESWESFATKLQNAGFAVLAIDLRGHGESGSSDYKNFSDAEHQASIHDVEAAVEFLKSKGVSEISLGGASIGANLALWYQAEHSEIKQSILLSPGFNYRGVETKPYAQKLAADQRVYFVADEDDERSAGGSAATMARELVALTAAQKEITIYTGSGHGTDIMKAHPELEDQLVGWLQR